ncbi:unnamed protein product [Brassica napus]|uniref:(rape) hypothetical protein n=1 Tax=Brassica napus TaxID=3708 RepID=A0A816QQ52_BRANA|nr:unnamed protein product [Brassica napus]
MHSVNAVFLRGQTFLNSLWRYPFLDLSSPYAVRYINSSPYPLYWL